MARLSDQEKEALLADIKATYGTSEGSVRKLAARHGTSDATVRRLAAEHSVQAGAGIAARDRTKNATEAKMADMAARRAEISQRMIDVAQQALDDMQSPAMIYNFGGKDNTYNEREVPRPPTGDQRNLMIIAATALDKHRMLDQYDSQQGFAAVVDDWLGDMLGRRGKEGGST